MTQTEKKAEIFTESDYGSEDVAWLLGINVEDEDEDEDEEYLAEVVFWLYDKPNESYLQMWMQDPLQKWRVEAMKEGGLPRRSAILAAELTRHFSCCEPFSLVVEDARNLCRHAAELARPASKAEIAEELWTLAAVLDIQVSEKQADFIIECIGRLPLPRTAVGRMCREIASNEKGRYLKPAIFQPFIKCAHKRWSKFRSANWTDYASIHEQFDEALAYCLQKEPSLNFDAKQDEGDPFEAELTFDADLNSGKAGA